MLRTARVERSGFAWRDERRPAWPLKCMRADHVLTELSHLWPPPLLNMADSGLTSWPSYILTQNALSSKHKTPERIGHPNTLPNRPLSASLQHIRSARNRRRNGPARGRNKCRPTFFPPNTTSSRNCAVNAAQSQRTRPWHLSRT